MTRRRRPPALVLAACAACAGCAARREPARVDLPAPLPAPRATASASVEAPTPAPMAFFPEDPSLDATAVANAEFVQETWSGAGTWQQHCIEWGMRPSRETAARDALNAKLASRGVHLPDRPRAKGVVVALGAYAPGVLPRGKLIKLVVCTEGVAPRSDHEAFAARLLADPRAPRAPAFGPLGAPDLAWNRVHADGEVEFGFRWPHADPVAAQRALGAVQSAHDDRFRVKLRGTDVWWTGLRKP
jgi:hypothetical protein